MKYISILLGLIVSCILLFLPSEEGRLKSILTIFVIILFVIAAIVEVVNERKSSKDQQLQNDKIISAIEKYSGINKLQIKDEFGNKLEEGKLYTTNNVKYMVVSNIIYVKSFLEDGTAASYILKLHDNGGSEVIEMTLPYPIYEYSLEIIPQSLIKSKQEISLDHNIIQHEILLDGGNKVTFFTRDGKLLDTPNKTGPEGPTVVHVMHNKRRFVITPANVRVEDIQFH